MKFLVAKNMEHQNLVIGFTLWKDLILMWSSVRDPLIASPQYIPTVHLSHRDKYVV
jgi:hypothetical protein